MLYHGLDDTFHNQEMQQIHASPDWHCWFIRNDHGDIIGLVELSLRNIVDGCLTSPVPYLEGLYLEPDQRGHGIGRTVMQQLIAWCRDRGYREFATDAELGNTAAQDFYAGLGFEETDRVVAYRLSLDNH